jgi:hypothetical protein
MDCWSLPHSLESWRAYNYPHVTTVYWSLYRAARYANPPLATRQPWAWYLRRAHATAMAVYRWGGDPWTKKQGGGVGTAQWGLMVGSIFELLLTDLEREGWGEEAAALQVSLASCPGVRLLSAGFVSNEWVLGCGRISSARAGFRVFVCKGWIWSPACGVCLQWVGFVCGVRVLSSRGRFRRLWAGFVLCGRICWWELGHTLQGIKRNLSTLMVFLLSMLFQSPSGWARAGFASMLRGDTARPPDARFVGHSFLPANPPLLFNWRARRRVLVLRFDARLLTPSTQLPAAKQPFAIGRASCCCALHPHLHLLASASTFQ